MMGVSVFLSRSASDAFEFDLFIPDGKTFSKLWARRFTSDSIFLMLYIFKK